MGAIGQNQRAAATDKLAVAALGQKYNETQLKETQQQNQIQQQIINAQKEGRSSVSKARASASEAGVSGGSVNEMQQTILNHVSDYSMTQRENLKGELAQDQNQEKEYQAQAEGEIASAPPASPLDLGLRIAGQGLGAYSSYESQLRAARQGRGS